MLRNDSEVRYMSELLYNMAGNIEEELLSFHMQECDDNTMDTVCLNDFTMLYGPACG